MERQLFPSAVENRRKSQKIAKIAKIAMLVPKVPGTAEPKKENKGVERLRAVLKVRVQRSSFALLLFLLQIVKTAGGKGSFSLGPPKIVQNRKFGPRGVRAGITPTLHRAQTFKRRPAAAYQFACVPSA